MVDPGIRSTVGGANCRDNRDGADEENDDEKRYRA